jgi:hypothetical protein
VLAGCVATGHAQVQERGSWRASSKTAQSITGDVAFGSERIVISFSGYAIAEIRPLKPEELMATFDLDSKTAGVGSLYRVSIPPEKRFLHKNTICGSDETQWVVTYVLGKELRLAFFSGGNIPALTGEGMAANTSLCGTFSYAR